MGKQALLVISFGTSYHDTYHKTIETICGDLRAAFPDSAFFLAYTSKMIIKKLKKRDGISVMTPAEAMEAIIAAGCDEVLCQTTHVINGHEFYGMLHELRPYLDRIPSIKIGRPLLSSHEDFEAVTDIVLNQIPELSPVDAAVLMGHGTEHAADETYARLRRLLSERVKLACVEGSQTLEELLPELDVLSEKRLTLMPLMLVAGDHAKNDLAGDGEDSWKRRLEARGFDVRARLEGLGRLAAVQRRFVEKARAVIS